MGKAASEEVVEEMVEDEEFGEEKEECSNIWVMAGLGCVGVSICQSFGTIVYLGLKQSWMMDGGRLWPATQPGKLLSADSFISVDIYQVNYPVLCPCLCAI